MKRIAFLGRGGHTLPSHRALLNLLSNDFEIIVYSEVFFQQEWLRLEHRYQIKCFTGMGLPRFLREPIFVMMLLVEHLRKPFHLVHAHSTKPAGLAAVILQKVFKVPALVSLDGGEGVFIPEAVFGDFSSRKRTALNKWVINHAKAVTALTLFQKELVVKNLQSKKMIEVVTRGVDGDQFGFIENRVIRQPITFLCVGYLSPIKNPEMLIRTFHLIQQKVDCRLIHIGKDYMHGRIHQMSDELGLSKKISFMGEVEYAQIYEFYKMADILLHTSYYESEAMVVAEAMASGVLVCGTSVGLMSDLLENCCVAVQSNNHVLLADSILNLIADEKRMNRLRENACIWSESNTLLHTCKKVASIYQSLLISQ